MSPTSSSRTPGTSQERYTLATGTFVTGSVLLWKNPFVEGRDGTHVDTIFKYIMNWDRLQLDGALDELTGKTIVCDCSANSFCHVDVIIAKWFDRPQRPRESRRSL